MLITALSSVAGEPLQGPSWWRGRVLPLQIKKAPNPYPIPPPINSSLSGEKLSIDQIFKVIFPTSYFRDNEKDKEGLVDDWKIVNLMRVIGAILGWMLLAWQPGKDHSDGK